MTIDRKAGIVVHGKATGGKAAILAPTVWQAAQDGAPLTLTVRKRNAPDMIRSLPASTVEALYHLIDPESSSNPFPRTQTRWRIIVSIRSQ